MSRSIKSPVIALALIIGAAVFWIYSWASEDHCDKHVSQVLRSPDGKWTATALQEECGGATGGIYYLVKLKSDGDDTLVFDIAPINSNLFELKWSDSRNLEIRYPGAKEVYTKLISSGDVKFSYIDTHNTNIK